MKEDLKKGAVLWIEAAPFAFGAECKIKETVWIFWGVLDAKNFFLHKGLIFVAVCGKLLEEAKQKKDKETF